MCISSPKSFDAQLDLSFNQRQPHPIPEDVISVLKASCAPEELQTESAIKVELKKARLPQFYLDTPHIWSLLHPDAAAAADAAAFRLNDDDRLLAKRLFTNK